MAQKIKNPQGKDEKEKGVSIKDSKEWNLLSLKFFSCMNKMQINPDTAKSMIAWSSIVQAYSVSYRKYHGKKHISRMIHLLIKYQSMIPESMFCMALVTICLHDFEECPFASAQKANEILKEANVKPEYIKTISRMILKTDHAKSPNLENGTEKLIVCLDLIPLAIDRQSFAKNTKHLWCEYKFQTQKSERSMIEKKGDFVSGCYHLFNVIMFNVIKPDKQNKIYPLPFFEEKYELKAKRNMKWFMNQPFEFWEKFLVD